MINDCTTITNNTGMLEESFCIEFAASGIFDNPDDPSYEGPYAQRGCSVPNGVSSSPPQLQILVLEYLYRRACL